MQENQSNPKILIPGSGGQLLLLLLPIRIDTP